MTQIATTSSPRLRTGVLIVVGAVCGLAWAAALRAWMSEMAGDTSEVSWFGTFGTILAPGLLVGALFGWAEQLRRRGGASGWRWLALAPLPFAIAPMLAPGALVVFLTTGIGGGAVGVPLFAMAGGYALSGRGPWWGRAVCALVSAAFVVGIALTPGFVGGYRLTVTEPRGAWVALLGASLMIVIALASAIPHRAVVARA